MAFTLFSRIVSEVVKLINNRYDANEPSWFFAYIRVTSASSMIASALKDDLYSKSGEKWKLIGYSIIHKNFKKLPNY